MRERERRKEWVLLLCGSAWVGLVFFCISTTTKKKKNNYDIPQKLNFEFLPWRRNMENVNPSITI